MCEEEEDGFRWFWADTEDALTPKTPPTGWRLQGGTLGQTATGWRLQGEH